MRNLDNVQVSTGYDLNQTWGPQFLRWRAALAGVLNGAGVARIWVVGDSVFEGYLQSGPSKRSVDKLRQSIQQVYRAGGPGFVSAIQLGTASDWTAAGSPPAFTDFGFGPGRKAQFFNGSGQSLSYTWTGDRCNLLYTTGVNVGGMKITLDGVATIIGTNATSGGRSGRVWDSGALTLGSHTVKVEADNTLVAPNNIFSVFFEGGVFYNSDYSAGIHVINGSHSGYTSAHFNGSNATTSYWSQGMDTLPPDLLIIEMGINDMGQVTPGTTTDNFKANIKSIVTTAIANGAPSNVSVVLVPLWGRADIKLGTPLVVTNTPGTNVITGYTLFPDSSDIGKTVTVQAGGGSLPGGTTITGVTPPTAPGQLGSMTLSNVTTGTVTGVTITGRSIVWSDADWTPWRRALYEVSQENGYAVWDMYDVYGYLGTDPQSLTSDKIHPTDKAAASIGQQLSILLTSMPGPLNFLSGGSFNYKGDMFVASADNTAAVLNAGADGQEIVYGSGGTNGLWPMRPGQGSAIGQLIPSTAGLGAALVEGLVAPTLTATVSTVDDNEAQWLNFATSTVQFNPSGIVSGFTVTRGGRLPEFSAMIKTDPSLITLVMNVIGLVSASADTLTPGNSPAAAVVGAYFRYNTIDDGTAFWRTVTSDGSTRTVTTTTTAYAVNTTYRLRIEVKGVKGTSISSVAFYINDVLVATHTTNLPPVGTALGYTARVETLTTVARNLKVARLSLAGP